MIKMESPISLEAGSSPVPLQAPAHSDSASSSGLSPSSMDNNSGPLSSGTGTPTTMTAAAAAAAASSSSRRPPRKSTLTQQQKNQKRQRATQDQLSTLEHEFNKNPTPGAEVRIQIANEINMTERSVQIWFQNRRAKIKLMAKKSLETGEDIDSIPESMRAYLAMQAIESGKGIGAVFLGRTGLGPHHGSGPWGSAVDGSSHAKVVITHLSCQSLSIGRWTRVSQNKMGLIIFYSAEKSTMTYYINNDQAGYKIEYPFSFIKNIQLDNGDADPAGRGGIIIELTSQPYFFMDSSPTAGGFCHTGDFTEDQQASQCLVHRLGGHPNVLSGQLAKLVSLEAFQQRHSPAPMPMPMAMPMPMPPTPSDPVGAMFDHRPMPMSAPVSPTNRPSSQPSFGPPAHIGMFQESWGIPNPHSSHHLAAHPHHSAMRGPGHKRQRSRSVPGPVDFSMFQPPMPSFYIQQPSDLDHHDNQHQQHHHQHQSPDIYSPVPQQPSGAMGPGGLRIDTQATLGLDARQYPVSAAATTVHSPAEFPSPGFFSQGPDGSATFGTPYSGVGDGGFLSPMANAASLIAPSVSPLSFASHTEPSIVEQSPPLSILGRPGSSADLYGGMDGSCAVSDDGTGLNELYSKHTINMSMPHSPGYSESGHGDIDMSQLVSFDHVDAAGLSPESMPQMHHHHHHHHHQHHHQQQH